MNPLSGIPRPPCHVFDRRVARDERGRHREEASGGWGRTPGSAHILHKTHTRTQ